MPIDHTALYAAGPDDVLAVLGDESFLRDYARALGARLQSVESTDVDGGTQTTLRLLVPTTGIPAVFTRFVGNEVAVVDRRTWTVDGDRGYRGGLQVTAEVFGRSAVVRGERRLTAVAGGTRSTVTGEAEVDAPLVGRQAEAAVRELALVVLRREDEVLRGWLGDPGS
ncbi:DUF2505 domain-containing protein [Geodermatophilus sp. TF02-6]|uniref:DUF2505 domain-containing protein n=1 Tax=Geodermatophilus sp. TF02-6 TaxID=2250575 RepID=UPI001314CAEA|nr:DUF2505 domain-containing protein [Geodermatophilus sp. TF02-6]